MNNRIEKEAYSPIKFKPIVSIIMPCHNAAKTVRQAIASIQAQTFKDWELILIDDGSQDKSLRLVQAIREPRIRCFNQANKGPSSARNKGIKKARGRYIAFLDADDTWHPQFLEKMTSALLNEHDVALAYCGWQNLGLEGGRGQPFVPLNYNIMDKEKVMLGGCRWPIHAALIGSSALYQAGGFDESLRAAEDYDLWLRIVTAENIVLVPEILAYYHHHSMNQATKDRLRSALSQYKVKIKFLTTRPQLYKRLGRRCIRKLVEGELLTHAYQCYWDRDLSTARTLFRIVMRSGYGKPRDWLYMLPAFLLPLSLHIRLTQYRDKR